MFVRRLGRVGASEEDLEDRMMAMLYRRHVEFAVGHGVSVRVKPSDGAPDRAVSVHTQVVRATRSPNIASHRRGCLRESSLCRTLGCVPGYEGAGKRHEADIAKLLAPLAGAYREWIDGEEKKLSNPNEGLSAFGDAASVAIANCRSTLGRIEAGLSLLGSDEQALSAFRFANETMWLQRTHSIFAEETRRGGQPDFDRDIDLPENRSWRPFQLAFILLNLPGVTDLGHPERSEGPDAVADLLFFPTGGGKTEAYLGLSAYTMGLREATGLGCRPGGRRRCCSTHAVHPAAAHHPAVPARHRADLRL